MQVHERRAAPLLRAAASRMTTPLLPDDYLHLLNPLWSAREQERRRHPAEIGRAHV